MVAWSLSGSISCFKVQGSIGHLVWFFDSGNSILSGVNFHKKYIEFISYWFKRSLTNQRQGKDDSLSPSPKAVQVC